MTVLLAGFAVSTVLGYSVSLLLFVSDQGQLRLQRIYGWLLGGISVTQWSQLGLAAVMIGAAMLGAWLLRHSLDALSLGEETAQQLGVSVESESDM